MGRVVIRFEELNDLREMLAGRSGHHAFSDLYRWHTEWSQKAAREPVHPIRLGQILSEHGAIRRQIWDKHRGHMVKGWVL